MESLRDPASETEDVYLTPIEGYNRCGLLKTIYPDDTVTYRVYHDGDMAGEYDNFTDAHFKYLKCLDYERTKQCKRAIVVDSRGRKHRWRERV